MKEWQDTSIASAKPSAEQSTTLLCRSSRGEGDRMQQEVELAPIPFDAREHGLELAGNAHVAGHDDQRT